MATVNSVYSLHNLISANTNNSTSIKASAGVLHGYELANINAAVRYVKFYNTVAAPTVGTDTPVLVVSIPAGTSKNLMLPSGVSFSLGIGIGVVTGIANSDNTAVAANEIIVNVFYK